MVQDSALRTLSTVTWKRRSLIPLESLDAQIYSITCFPSKSLLNLDITFTAANPLPKVFKVIDYLYLALNQSLYESTLSRVYMKTLLSLVEVHTFELAGNHV